MQGASDAARVQLCGTFAVELAGRRVNQALPGRQGRLLFAYLTLSRLQPVPRDVLVDALWGESPPPAAASALTVLVSKVRTVLGPDVLRGRTELTVALPEPAYVDVEDAFAALHAAESALARQDWRKAWAPALTAQFVARRRFLPEAEQPWADPWRRRLADVHVRALECYATACLRLGGGELPGAERAARRAARGGAAAGDRAPAADGVAGRPGQRRRGAGRVRAAAGVAARVARRRPRPRRPGHVRAAAGLTRAPTFRQGAANQPTRVGPQASGIDPNPSEG